MRVVWTRLWIATRVLHLPQSDGTRFPDRAVVRRERHRVCTSRRDDQSISGIAVEAERKRIGRNHDIDIKRAAA